MPYTFTLTTTIPASAQEIYDTWLDSVGHSEMTGGEASMSDQIGAEVSAWDGYISGRNLELVPGERIVQSWRTDRFTDDHDDSIITVTLEEIDGETLLTLIHANVPDGQTSYQRGGWQERYFEPMIEHFTALMRDPDVETDEDSTAPAPAIERAPAAPKQTAKPAKPKSERAAAPKAKSKSAKKAKPKARPGAKPKTKVRVRAKAKAKARAKPKTAAKAKASTKAKTKGSGRRKGR